MKYSENVLNILTAKSYKGVGNAWIVKNIKGGESVQEIVKLLNKPEVTQNSFNYVKENIRTKLSKIENSIDGVVAIGDEYFPEIRGKVKQSEMPVCLFYKGDISLLQKENRNISVIGLLQPDYETKEFEEKVVRYLVKNDITIVSGLAFGCDSIAHQATIDNGGKTIAILPSCLNNIVPAKNRKLADDILKNGGLLVTEYYQEASSKREFIGRYIERDRLQALFSDVVILSASYSQNNLGNDSGSRHAMNYALQYSLPRAVMYDERVNVSNPKYDLNREIIESDRSVFVIDEYIEKSVDKLLNLMPKNIIKQESLF